MNDYTPSRFNLSDWALRHRAIVLYAMIALAVIGAVSYQRLGQSEAPPFTFKIMLIRTFWPGATAQEVMLQVTDKIERKLQETPYVDRVTSFSKPGESVVLFVVKDSAPSSEIPNVWYQVRKKLGDIRQSLPANIQGPFFNDEFGDVYGNLYAVHGKGYTPADLKRFADKLRAELLRVPDVNKVDYFGEQDERLFIEFNNAKIANIGLDFQTIVAVLQGQNTIIPQGAFETRNDRVGLRISGSFTSLDEVRETTFRVAGRVIRLGDIAEVKRGYIDPPFSKARFNGMDTLVMGVSMAKGGDILQLGKNLDAFFARAQAELPVGMEIGRIADQPQVVQRAVGEFIRSLVEAVLIVLAVCFLSLGFRTGIVVALSIPLVLAATFLCMRLLGVDLHQISLGALILALGLLVDDAIIAVEMMARKMEQGWERMKAASFAYDSTAMPMLSGTLVTAAGFLPIATAQSSTGEYTRSIFQVTVIALLISWVAAIIFIPYLGYKLLPDVARQHAPMESPLYRFLRKVLPFLPKMSAKPAHGVDDEDAVYQTRFFRGFRRVVEWCVRFRWVVIIATVMLFGLSVWGFKFIQQQFFPSSTRLEVLVDLRLPNGASFTATDTSVRKLETYLAKQSGIENWVAYIGTGSPRFYLPLDQQQPNTFFAQFVINTSSIAGREALRSNLITLFDIDFPELRASIQRLENGPPVGFPVQFRVSGPDIPEVRRIAREVASAMRVNPHLANVQFDWDEASKVVRLEIDQEKARLVGLTTQDVRLFLATAVSGFTVTSYREENKAIDIVIRGSEPERAQLSLLENLQIPTRAGKSITITQIAKLDYSLEEGVIWRRNRFPTVTVRANVYGENQSPTITNQILPALEPIKQALPYGYRIETGGTVEESARGAASVTAGFPLFIFAVFTILMLQLQSFARVALVVLTAPLGLIGVTSFLLLFNQPFGFVAQLGTIALSGMIMRNSVILVDQIDQDIRAGHTPWRAIVDATVRRCRPIALTALAAVIAMVPLSRSTFFGPMAVAIMGGLIVATLLTLLFLPALYAAWFRVKPDPA